MAELPLDERAIERTIAMLNRVKRMIPAEAKGTSASSSLRNEIDGVVEGLLALYDPFGAGSDKEASS